MKKRCRNPRAVSNQSFQSISEAPICRERPRKVERDGTFVPAPPKLEKFKYISMMEVHTSMQKKSCEMCWKKF